MYTHLLEVYFKPEKSEEVTRLERTQTPHINTQIPPAFMDPKFKTLSFISDEHRLNVVAFVEAKEVILAINNISLSNLSTSTELETTGELDLPFSKKCRVSKAEKCLLLILSSPKIRWLLPLRRPKLSLRRQMNKHHVNQQHIIFILFIHSQQFLQCKGSLH